MGWVLPLENPSLLGGSWCSLLNQEEAVCAMGVSKESWLWNLFVLKGPAQWDKLNSLPFCFHLCCSDEVLEAQ